RDLAFSVGALSEEYHFEAVRVAQRGEPGYRSWFNLAQRRPEVFDLRDVRPEIAQLAAGEHLLPGIVGSACPKLRRGGFGIRRFLGVGVWKLGVFYRRFHVR